MNEQDNIGLIRKIYAAFGTGDVQTILDSVADGADWINHGPVTVPYAGSHIRQDANPGVFPGDRRLYNRRQSNRRQLHRAGRRRRRTRLV